MKSAFFFLFYKRFLCGLFEFIYIYFIYNKNIKKKTMNVRMGQKRSRLSAKLLKADLFKLIKKKNCCIDIYRVLINKIFQFDRHRN